MSETVDHLALVRAVHSGGQFLVLRDGAQHQRIVPLQADHGRYTVGRRSECDVHIDWDPQVSRVHCELLAVGGRWAVTDDGLSTNGTFVNRERIVGRRLLVDLDLIRVGSTQMLFRAPPRDGTERPTVPGAFEPPLRLTDSQKGILVALCRPVMTHRDPAVPATNDEIATEVGLSVDAVKSHLRTLFTKFAVPADLGQNRKRARLVELTIARGAVSPGDYAAPR
ncbi:MAG: FHA domain-containing protein [Thermoleophilia bacterium]